MLKHVIYLVLIATVFPILSAAQDRKPNIVFVLIDDLGARDLGCYGSTFHETPNLDSLANAGVRVTNAYAACNVCSPTRASILTGKSPARLHLTDWLPGKKDAPNLKLRRPPIVDHLAPGEVNVAHALKAGGYATGFVGKWHLGAKEFWPDKQGFDVNIGGCGIGHPPSYFSPYKIPALVDGPPGEYLTDRLTDEACKFIEFNKDRPFFLYLSHYAVHNPQQAKKEHVDKFKAKLAATTHAAPELIDDLGRKVRQVQNNPVYAANVASMDESVGRIRRKLAELKLDQNTIVVFTSDNGGLSTAEGTPTSNVPLRMGKGWNYEGGIRVPLLVLWPGVTKPGSTSDTPVISTDHYPTFLEAAGLPPRPEQHMDGASFAPVLKGSNAGRDRPLFWHYPHYSNQGGPPGGAIRLGDYKLIEHFETMTAELYNLKDDPRERNDLAAAEPDRAKELRSRLHAWRQSVGAEMPTPNPDFDPAWKPRPAGAARDQ